MNVAQLVGSRRHGHRVREWFLVVSTPLGGHVRVCIVGLCASGLRVDAVVRMVHGWGGGYFWDRQRVLARMRFVCRALFLTFL